MRERVNNNFIALLQQLSPARDLRCRSTHLIARSCTDVHLKFDSLATNRALGELTMTRTARWGYEKIAGILTFGCWTVDMDELRGGWPFARREWRIINRGTGTTGALTIPALWGMFTLGPRLRISIPSDSASPGIEIAYPQISWRETVGYFRVDDARHWVPYCIITADEQRPMFDDIEPFLDLPGTCRVILLAGLLSVGAFPSLVLHLGD